MMLTPRKKIAAAIIALSAVFAGVALMTNGDGNENDRAAPDVTAPAVTPPAVTTPDVTTPDVAAPEPAPAPPPADVQIETDTPAPVPVAAPTVPVRTLPAAPDEAAATRLIQTLRTEATSANPGTRIDAARMLESIAIAHPNLAGQIMPIAINMARNSTEIDVRIAGVHALSGLSATFNAKGVAATNLIGMLAGNQAEPAELRAAATATLGDIGTRNHSQTPLAAEILLSVVADAEPAVRHAAIRALGRIGAAYQEEYGYYTVNQIGTRLNDTDTTVRDEARTWARYICTNNRALRCPSIP